MRRLLCFFGKHKRSKSQAREEGRIMISVCRYCGKPMVRIDREWQVNRLRSKVAKR